MAQAPQPGPQSSNIPIPVAIDQWQGVNQSSNRSVISDQELWWCENFFPIAPGHLRSGWGPSAPLYTAPSGTQILRIFFANITTNNPLGFMFLSNGTVDAVDLNSGAVHSLGQIWGPATPPYYADLKLWLPNQYGNVAGEIGGVLIGSPQGLYAVDGNFTVTAPGQAAPMWLTNGQTTDATGATITMPTGLPGIYAMEVYKERLWVMGQTVVSFSAPTTAVVFSTAGGGGSFPYWGDQLTASYTDLVTAGGFLFVFGDSMVNYISDLTLAGQGTVYNPLTTQFLYANVDPQNGQRFFRPVGNWSVFQTTYTGAGIHILTSQSQPMQLISQKVTNLYATLNSAPFQPTQSPCDIFGQRWMLFNGTFTDPFGVSRSMMLCWNGQIWTIATQHYALTNIGHIERDSMIHAYGTDGTVLVELFQQPDESLEKRLATKMYEGQQFLIIKHWKRIYTQLKDNQNGPNGVSLTGMLTTQGGSIPNGSEAVAFDLLPGRFDVVPQPTFGAGLTAHLDLTSLSPDFTVERISFTYDERTLYGA
jgi:hypothetical protein